MRCWGIHFSLWAQGILNQSGNKWSVPIDLGFKLFEKAEKEPPTEKGASCKSVIYLNAHHLMRSFQCIAVVVCSELISRPISFPVVKKNEPKDIRNFDYTARSWTGKSPKQFLIDWVRKNLPKSPPPAFHKVPAGRYWKCKYVCFSVLLL